jgi:hypothetical protein
MRWPLYQLRRIYCLRTEKLRLLWSFTVDFAEEVMRVPCFATKRAEPQDGVRKWWLAYRLYSDADLGIIMSDIQIGLALATPAKPVIGFVKESDVPSTKEGFV